MNKASEPSPEQPIRLIDTHCHLEMEPFASDLPQVLARAREARLDAMITVASDPKSNQKALAIANAHEDIYCTIGLHPHDARHMDAGLMDNLRKWASSGGKVVAIGETGLDYHYDNSPREAQREAFKAQLALAMELNLPAVIHAREADDDAIRIIADSGITRGVFHCFSGSEAVYEFALSRNFLLSFAGPLTFPKATGLRAAASKAPDELLLVETDAPYLAPVPLRGKRNEPAYVRHTAAELAKLRGVTLEDIARITTLNARRFFGIGALAARGEIAYKIRDSLYLNLTNRCTNRCTFCVRSRSDFVKGHNLRLDHEPSTEQLISAIGDPARYSEIVFCGYGEPLIRLDAVKQVAAWVKSKGGRVRVNTNGQANLIHRRDILPELKGLVDSVSVSLDAHDSATYERICEPAMPGAFDAVVSFIREAKAYIPEVKATVVTAQGVDIERCRSLAAELGIELRIRELDIVG